MLRLFFLLSILFQLNLALSQAPICGENGSSVDMPFQITDQDGLGTCFANTTALLVQNAVKDENPVSYQHIAIQSFANNDNLKVIKDGGWICHSFEKIKKSGYCNADPTNSEFYNKDDISWYQSTKLNLYKKVLDLKIDFTKVDDTFWEKMKYALIPKLKRCLHRSRQDLILEGYLVSTAKVLKKRIDEIEKMPCPANCTIGLLTTNSLGKDDVLQSLKSLYTSTTITIDKPVKDSNVVSFDSNTKNVLLKLSKGDENVLDMNLIDALGINFKSPFPNIKLSQLLFDSQKDKNQFSLNNCQSNAIAQANSCEIETILSKLNLEELYSKDLCEMKKNLKISPQVEELQKTADQLIVKLKGFAQSDKSNIARIIDYLFPNCSSKIEENKQKLQSLQCKTYDLEETETSEEDWKVYNKEYIKNIGIEEEQIPIIGTDRNIIRSRAHNKIMSSLCENKVVGMSLCTHFLRAKNSEMDTHFCDPEILKKYESIEGHGFHSVTLVGFKKDQQGNTSYLIQNSWGRSCLEFESPKKPHIKCEVKNGRTTGRFWVDANFLINNTDDFSVIENEI